MKVSEFLYLLEDWYHNRGRHDLLWRQKKYLNPYAIAVSEVMLQQTQVVRVVGYFQRWMEQFPDVVSLANATNASVLTAWQGLGYNNRGLRLKKLAQVITHEYSGEFPRDRKTLEALPGIGPYTAGAIRAFVWNEPEVFVETNIRRVFIYHFLAHRQEAIGDREILELLTKIVPRLRVESSGPPPISHILSPRNFYWALMDYGASLPKVLKSNPNKQSKHYSVQSRFEGSVRQVRSGILKWLLENHSLNITDTSNVLGIMNPEDERIKKAIKGLERDGLIDAVGSQILLRK